MVRIPAIGYFFWETEGSLEVFEGDAVSKVFKGSVILLAMYVKYRLVSALTRLRNMYKKDNYLRAVKSTSDQRHLYIPPPLTPPTKPRIYRVNTLGNRVHRALRYLGRYCILFTRQA